MSEFVGAPRCAAVLFTRCNHRSGGRKDYAGKRCAAAATNERDGKPVCWVHKGAIREVEYAEQETPA